MQQYTPLLVLDGTLGTRLVSSRPVVGSGRRGDNGKNRPQGPVYTVGTERGKQEGGECMSDKLS